MPAILCQLQPIAKRINLVLAKSLIGNMDGKLVGGCGPFPVAVSAQLSVCPANCGGHRTTLMIPHIQIVKSNTMPIYKYHYHLTMVSAVSKDCSNHYQIKSYMFWQNIVFTLSNDWHCSFKPNIRRTIFSNSWKLEKNKQIEKVRSLVKPLSCVYFPGNISISISTRAPLLNQVGWPLEKLTSPPSLPFLILSSEMSQTTSWIVM